MNTKALAQTLTAQGVKIHWATWDWSQAKGVDDALRAGCAIQIAWLAVHNPTWAAPPRT
jgi:hypothetical protein